MQAMESFSCSSGRPPLTPPAIWGVRMFDIACEQAPTSGVPRNPYKGHAALRRGRTSVPGAEYFLTICTDQRRTGLATAVPATAILSEMRNMDADKSWQLRCALVMPNHVHLLMILGERLSLGKCVGRLKAKTLVFLRTASTELEWERGLFDRRIRSDEDRIGLFLYIFLNPYRAGLCARTDRWPWYYCREEDWTWFKDYLDADRPPPEWLKE